MGSLTLYKKKARGQSSGWGGWGTISGADYISSGNSAHVVYSANLNLGGQALSACTVKTNFVANSSSHAATLKCYLYTSDPTSGSPSAPPAGYAAVVSASVTVPYYGLYQTFSFTGLNITSGTKLYFWFVDENSSSTVDYLYSSATGNGYTANPTASGTFTALPLSLSISPDSVATGSDVTLNVANGAGISLTATISYSGTTLKTETFTGGSCTITCLKAWFDTANVTLLDSITLTVTVTGGGSTLTGYFTLTAGEDMRPVVGTPTVTLVQASSASDFPSTYIANISKAKVEAAVTLPTDAVIDSVVLSFTGGSNVTMTLNSGTGKYEATTAGPLTGDTTFLVTAADKRGLSGSNTASVTGVMPYTPPSVVYDEEYTYRCDALGAKTAGGAYYRVKVAAVYDTGLSGNAVTKLNVKLKNDSSTTNLTSGVQSSAIGGSLDAKTAYIIVVTVKDKISGDITRELKLPGMQRNLVIKRSADGTYVGVGMAPAHSSGGSTIELPSGGKIYIGGTELVIPDLTPYALAANVAAKSFTLVGTTDNTQYSPISLPASFSELIVEWEDARYSQALVHTAHICVGQLSSTPRLFAYGDTLAGDGKLGCTVSLTEADINDSNAPSTGTFTMKVYAR